MAIYGRFGNEVTIVRMGTLDDVRTFDRRKADKQDRDALAAGSYVITREVSSGQERLAHLAYLRADDGAAEIMCEVRRVQRDQTMMTLCGSCETEWPTDSGLQVCPKCGYDGEDGDPHVVRFPEG